MTLSTQHVSQTPKPQNLIKFTEPSHFNVIKGGSKSTNRLVGTKTGTVSFMLANGQVIVLKEALYVPNLSCNLISLAQLIKEYNAHITRHDD